MQIHFGIYFCIKFNVFFINTDYYFDYYKNENHFEIFNQENILFIYN